MLALLAGGAIAQPVDTELVLAADGSGSIDDAELALQRQGYAAAIRDPGVLAAIQGGFHGAIALAYVEWGGPASQELIVDWRVVRDAASAEAFAQALIAAPRAASGWNSISEAIAFSHALIENNAFDAAAKIIDVSGDGPQLNGRPLELMRTLAVQDGVTINALAIGSRGGGYRGPGGVPLEQHYAADVIGGFGAFVMTVDEETPFARAVLAKMVREIADGARMARRFASGGAAGWQARQQRIE